MNEEKIWHVDEVLHAETNKSFERINTLLDFLSEEFGTESLKIEEAENCLKDGDFKMAYLLLQPLVWFEDLKEQFHVVEQLIDDARSYDKKPSPTSNKPLMN